MRFSRSLLVAAIMSAAAGLASAEDVTIRNQSEADTALTSTGSPITISNSTNSVIKLEANAGKVNFDGKNQSVTFVGTGVNNTESPNHNGGAGFNVFNADETVFSNFEELTFQSSSDSSVGFVFGQGGVQFGESSKAIGSLTFDNVTLSNWWDGGQPGVDIYADALTFTKDAVINTASINVHATNAESQTTTFEGNLSVWNADVSVDGGSVAIEGKLNVNGNSALGASVTLGTADEPLTNLTVGDGITTVDDGTLTIASEKTTVTGSVSNNGSGMTVTGGTFEVKNGNIISGSALHLGTAENQLESVKIDGLSTGAALYTKQTSGATAETPNTTYIYADVVEITGSIGSDAEGLAQNVFSAVTTTITNESGKGAALSGQAIFKNTGNADQSLTISTAGTSGAVLLGDKSRFAVESGSVDITGGMQSNTGSTVAFGSENQQLTSVAIKAGTTGLNASLKAIDSTIDIYAKELTVEGNGTNSAIRSENGGQMTLAAETATIKKGAVGVYSAEGKTSSLTVSGGSFRVEDGFVYNNGKLSLGTEDDQLTSLFIETAEGYEGAALHTNDNYGTTEAPTTTSIYTDNLTINSVSGNGIGGDTGAQNVIHAVTTVVNAKNYALNGTAIFKDTGDDNQSLTLKSTASGGTVLIGDQSTFAVENGSVDIQGCVQANVNGTIQLGTADNALSSVKISGEGSATTHVLRSHGGDVTVNAAAVEITATEGQTALNSFTAADSDKSGNLTVTASDSLLIQGEIIGGRDDYDGASTVSNSLLTINGAAATKIVSDVRTYNDAAQSTDNQVIINLDGAQSQFSGSVQDEGATAGETGTTLNLKNAADWTVTADSQISKVAGTGGTIHTDGNALSIDAVENSDAGTTIVTNSGAAGQIAIGDNTGEGLRIAVTGEGVNELDGNNLAASLRSIADIAQSDASVTVTSEEGALIGESVVVLDENGTIASFTEKENTVNAGLQDIAASNFLFFRSTMNDVNKRMGDLRTMPKSAGAWARYYGGEAKYGDMGMKTNYNTLQIGADQWIDNFYVGLSASISDGNGDLDNGSVDDRNYNFGLYAGWVADNGQYVDFIVKRHRLESEGTLFNTSGTRNAFDFNNWGTSVSVEYGWRFQCPSTNFWLEPQAELMYGRLDSVDFRTSQNAKVEQDAIDTLVGRLGASFGWTSPDKKGSAYFKASVLHDWKAETESTVYVGNAHRSFEDDLGGTWGEFALGGTYNVTDSLSAYGDVMTTVGSPVRTPWQLSVGLRYVW